CSAIHPLALGSPFLSALPLGEHGLELVQPPAPLAHPFDDGTAAVLERSLDRTADALGADGAAYRRLFGPLVRDAPSVLAGAPPRGRGPPLARAPSGPAPPPPPPSPARRSRGRDARALFAGSAAHSMLALSAPPSAAFGVLLTMLGHAVGWPLARGGSQRIAD